MLGFLWWTTTEGIVVLTLLNGVSQALFIVTMSPCRVENSGKAERTHLFSMNQAVIAVAGVAGGIVGGNAPAWLGAWLGVGANDVRAYQAGIGAATLINFISMFPLFMLRNAPLTA